jgi:hypothetical protein
MLLPFSVDRRGVENSLNRSRLTRLEIPVFRSITHINKDPYVERPHSVIPLLS